MVQPVDDLAGAFVEAGADLICFHPEASAHIDRTLQLINGGGCKAGLAFNPATSLDALDYVIDKVDLVLIMSVNPGFGGQSFIESALRKVQNARKLIDSTGRDIRLEVDGGIKAENIRRVAEAGADTFVAGSAIFGSAGLQSRDQRHAHRAAAASRPRAGRLTGRADVHDSRGAPPAAGGRITGRQRSRGRQEATSARTVNASSGAEPGRRRHG